MSTDAIVHYSEYKKLSFDLTKFGSSVFLMISAKMSLDIVLETLRRFMMVLILLDGDLEWCDDHDGGPC